jgi:hypothetical protein
VVHLEDRATKKYEDASYDKSFRFTISTINSSVFSGVTATFAERISSLFSVVTRSINCLYFPRIVKALAGPITYQCHIP